MSKLDNVKIRILNADEFSREDLVSVFRKNKSNVPNPSIANIVIAENENNKIVGFAVLQPQYHAEPIYVDREYRDTNLHKELIDELLGNIPTIAGLQIFVFAPNDKIVELAKRFGFQELDYKVFVRKS